jgi:hypothetical protein
MAAGEETLPSADTPALLQGLATNQGEGGSATGAASLMQSSPYGTLAGGVADAMKAPGASSGASGSSGSSKSGFNFSTQKTVNDQSFKKTINFGSPSFGSGLSRTAIIAIAVAVPGGLAILAGLWYWLRKKG